MPAERILDGDTLKVGKDKLNKAIEQANKSENESAAAVATSGNAVSIANTAKLSADSTRTELDAVVNRETDSDAMSRQAAVDADGVDQVNLKQRLDKEYKENAKKVAEAYLAEYAARNVKDYIYNFDVGLNNWFSKIAAFRSVSSKTIDVNMISDSIAEGNAAGNANPADYFTKGFLGQLKSKFNAKFGDAGQGFIPVYITTNAPLWSFTGFVQETGYFGATGISRMSQVNGDKATLSFNGTGIGIVFPKRSNAGSLSVSIDGGPPVVINAYSASEVYADKYEISGLVNGPHTMVITSQLAVGEKVWIHGAYEIKATTGVRFNMVGRSGAASGALATTAAMPAEIDVWKPTLTIIALTANDYGGQVPLANYEANLQTLITRAKRFGDVLLVSTGLEIPIANEAIPQNEYVKIQRKLADLNKVAFFDIFHMWSGDAHYAKEILQFIHDHVHPTDKGHADMADKLFDVLTLLLSQGSVFVSENTKYSEGILESSVIGRGTSGKMIKAFGHRQETTAKDLLVFSHLPPANSSDSATIIGSIRVTFSGRNTGGVRAHGAKEYDFYYDNDKNMTIAEKRAHLPVTFGSSIAIEISRKNSENVAQILITPSSNALVGQVLVRIEYEQSFAADPIDIRFSPTLV